jgi:hypothetical protein
VHDVAARLRASGEAAASSLRGLPSAALPRTIPTIQPKRSARIPLASTIVWVCTVACGPARRAGQSHRPRARTQQEHVQVPHRPDRKARQRACSARHRGDGTARRPGTGSHPALSRATRWGQKGRRPTGQWTVMPLKVPLTAGQILGSMLEKAPQPGAPLRNRTVDLLLTMNTRQVPSPQAGRIEQGKHEPPQALTSSR